MRVGNASSARLQTSGSELNHKASIDQSTPKLQPRSSARPLARCWGRGCRAAHIAVWAHAAARAACSVSSRLYSWPRQHHNAACTGATHVMMPFDHHWATDGRKAACQNLLAGCSHCAEIYQGEFVCSLAGYPTAFLRELYLNHSGMISDCDQEAKYFNQISQIEEVRSKQLSSFPPQRRHGPYIACAIENCF